MVAAQTSHRGRLGARKEIAQDNSGGRLLHGVCQGQIVLGVLIGSKAMSKPITLAPSRDSMSTSAASLDLGQGQRPSVARLFSSITASTTAGKGRI